MQTKDAHRPVLAMSVLNVSIFLSHIIIPHDMAAVDTIIVLCWVVYVI